MKGRTRSVSWFATKMFAWALGTHPVSSSSVFDPRSGEMEETRTFVVKVLKIRKLGRAGECLLKSIRETEPEEVNGKGRHRNTKMNELKPTLGHRLEIARSASMKRICAEEDAPVEV